MGTWTGHYVEISEHHTVTVGIPFTTLRETRPEYPADVSRLYGPYTAKGAERVARRALAQIPGHVTTYQASGARYVSGEQGTRMVKIHQNGLPAVWASGPTARYLPADVDTRPIDCERLGDHHSRDRVTVWHGAPTPYLLCGFHASQVGPELFRRLAAPKPQGTLWVCDDCMSTEANGEDPDDRPATEPEPWALEPATDVTMGLMSEDHDCDDPTSGECSCERREFSWASCDGCGSALGGSRYAYVWWA